MDTQKFDPQSVVGEVLGGCLLLELIGRGAMGAVYEARQVSLDRRVAVKVHQIADDGDTDVRGTLFMNEARLVARVNHPNIVQIFDVGRHRDLLYMIMEYVEGVTFGDILVKQQRLPVDVLYGVARKVTCGLAAAHKENIVHGDIKPENVLLTSHGEMKIADFGAASFLLGEDEERQTLIGTPLYMAPEIIARDPKTGLADVYALGLVLYTAVSGAHPFYSRDVRCILRSHLETPVVPLAERSAALPRDFADVIDTLISKEPHERPSSDELLEVLERHPEWGRCQVAHDEPVGSTPRRPGSFRVKISGSTGGSSKVRELCIQARFQVMKRQWDRAEICFRRALEVDPDCEAALLGLARLQIEQNDHDAAVATLERALERGTIDPVKILESKHFEPLKTHKEFRELMASLTL